MYQHATKIGAMALLLWSFGPLFNKLVTSVPLFEILTFSFGSSFLAGICYLTVTKRWSALKQPIIFSLIGFAGVFGNELLFVTAFKHAPAAHITLLSYLWPIYVISLSWLVRKEKFSYRYLFAALVGFTSVAFYILQDAGFIALEYWLGYLAILLASFVWSIYTLVNTNAKRMPSEMITLYCGLGFIIALILHLNIESFYLPTINELSSLLWLGLIGIAVAFKAWDFGVKYGNARLLSVLTYNNVFFATSLLILFNQATFSLPLLIATAGVISATAIALFRMEAPVYV